MPKLFNIAKSDQKRGAIPVYRLDQPEDCEDYARMMAKKFKADGMFADRGSRLVLKNRDCVLEVYEGSGSIWWTRATRMKTERRRPARKMLPEKEAVAKAGAFLRSRGLADKNAGFSSLEYTEVFFEEDGKKTTRAVLRQHVNYRFRLDGLPVFGPGAKMQVTFDGGSDVSEAFRFWRPPSAERGEIETVPFKDAVEKFKRLKNFNSLVKGEATVDVFDIALGYYALPPREVQRYLVPVYRFEGRVSTPQFDGHEFSIHIPALELDQKRLKKSKAIVTAVPQHL